MYWSQVRVLAGPPYVNMSENFSKIDETVFGIIEKISKALENSITDKDKKLIFRESYSKFKRSRHAGSGRAGGKLQRDALCTRGRTNMSPIANRNLRWHPLVVSLKNNSYSKKIERVEVTNTPKKLIFYIKINDTITKFNQDNVYNLPERYAVTSTEWELVQDKLKDWTRADWAKIHCVIPSLECCDPEEAVKVYANLGIIIAVSLFKSDINDVYPKISAILSNNSISSNNKLLTENFPKIEEYDNLIKCPICKYNLGQEKPLETFRKKTREEIWNPPWSTKKRSEGDDSSIQIMHMNPLVEGKINHNVRNTRYGHRWCNVSMTDHSLHETLDFFKHVVKVHNES